MQRFGWRKYGAVFLLTVAVFLTALYVSNQWNRAQLREVRAIEDKIAINLLSSETQFALLQEELCTKVNTSMLSGELHSLAERLRHSQNHASDPEFRRLKKYYSLLEIKDYLLVKQLNAKCGVEALPLLYFYSEQECPTCERTGAVLSHVRQKYPALRVYSFDADLNLSAAETLETIYDIDRERLPAIVIGEDVFYGAHTQAEIVEKLPPFVLESASTTTATSTDQ